MDGLERYGDTMLSRGKLLIRIGTNALWRQLVAVELSELAHIKSPKLVPL
jgi:hypothetical protein